MASPLPEPYHLEDVLTDGVVLTCLADVRGEKVLVHVLPADTGAREKVLSRLARAPRNPNFLDRLDHEGHALIVTRRTEEMENFEAWLDEVAPERVDHDEGDATPSGPTRLVLDIRAAAAPGADARRGSVPPAPTPPSEEAPTVEREAYGSAEPPPEETPSAETGTEARKTALHLSAFVPPGEEDDDARDAEPPVDREGAAAADEPGPAGRKGTGTKQSASGDSSDRRPAPSEPVERPQRGARSALDLGTTGVAVGAVLLLVLVAWWLLF